MSPARRAAVAVVLILVAVWVARLLAGPLGVAPWIAALVALLLVTFAFLAGVALRRRT